MLNVAADTPVSNFVYLSLTLAVIACVWNLWSWFTSRANHDALVMTVALARGLLAGFYAGAYIWLIAHPGRRLQWSETMSGVAWVSWIVVYIAPAHVLAHTQKRAVRRQSELAEMVDNITADRTP